MFCKSRLMSLSSGAAAAVALIALSTPTVQANLITNGDFSENAADYTTDPGYSAGETPENPASPTGWTISRATGSGGVGINGPDTGLSSAPFAPASTTGVRDFAFIQFGPQSLSQNVTTVAGQVYRLTYDAGQRNSTSESPVVLNVIVADATPSGSQITSQTPTLTKTDFTHFALNFTAVSELTEIKFLNNTASASPATASISNVTLTTVPEPATLGLLTVGTLGLLLKRRGTSPR